MFRLRSGRFKSIFLSYFMLVLIPALIISCIYLTYVFKMAEADYKETYLADLRHSSVKMETVLDNIENISLQLSLTPELTKIFNKSSQLTADDYLSLREDVSHYILSNALFHSIYVYFVTNDKVLTSNEGLYARKEFYDKTLIDSVLTSDNKTEWLATRPLPDNIDASKTTDVITFSRTLPVGGKYMLGNVIFNLKEDVFSVMLSDSERNPSSDLFIVGADGKIIVHKDRQMLYKPITDTYFSIEGFDQSEGIQRITYNHHNYFALYHRSSNNNWMYISLIPYDELMNRLYEHVKAASILFVTILLIGGVLSYFLSVKMYLPWNQLLVKIGTHLQNAGRHDKAGDEFLVISDTFDRLIQDNRDITTLIEKNKPVLRDRFIADLLWNNLHTYEQMQESMDIAGVNFEFPYFMTAIAALSEFPYIDDHVQRRGINLYIRDLIERRFNEDFSAAGILLDEDKLAFIFNIPEHITEDERNKKIKDTCSEINRDLNEQLNISVNLSFGSVDSDPLKIGDSFLQTKKALHYRVIANKENVIFSESEDNQFLYPMSLQRTIANGIKTCDWKAVDQAITRLFKKHIDERNYSLDKIRNMMVILMSAVVNDLLMEGIALNTVDDMNILTRIGDCKDSEELKEFAQSCFSQMIKEHAELKQHSGNRYLADVIEFIEQNYHRDIAIHDIANHAGLNPAYLSRLFKQSTGKTLVEFLTLHRMEKGKELLTSTHLTMKEISMAIGYNDVQSFVRFFKRYVGTTPSDYRVAHQYERNEG